LIIASAAAASYIHIWYPKIYLQIVFTDMEISRNQ